MEKGQGMRHRISKQREKTLSHKKMADHDHRDPWRHMWRFKTDGGRCMICWERCPNPEVHEIPRGPHRRAALTQNCCYLATCSLCHQGELDSMPIVDQLAIKKALDPENYDRARVNIIRQRQPEAITEQEVDLALTALQKERPWLIQA
jgi:hypothetical protein